MAKYVKKPVVIDAFKLTGETSLKEIYSFFGVTKDDSVKPFNIMTALGILEIKTLEGTMVASTGDYIIKGIKGEFYPCKEDIFEQTYSLVTE